MNQERDYRELMCHGKGERCLLLGYELPICSRCFGFYTGVGLGIIFTLFYDIHPISATELLLLTAIALVPMALDGITQEIGDRESENWLRLSTGLIAGSIIGIDIIWIILQT